MRKSSIRLVYVLAVAMTLISVQIGIAGPQEATNEMSPEMQAEMEAWAKLAQPGPHHVHLKPFAGKWKGDVKMWMEPGAEPMVEEAIVEAKWTLDGRFLEWTHTGEFGGMPFHGRAIDGYNNGDGRYESVWMDNFGTLMIFYTGECSDEGKTRVLTGEFSNPMDDSMTQYRVVYSLIDEDHFTYESFMKRGDTEYQNMETKYSRQ